MIHFKYKHLLAQVSIPTPPLSPCSSPEAIKPIMSQSGNQYAQLMLYSEQATAACLLKEKAEMPF